VILWAVNSGEALSGQAMMTRFLSIDLQ